MSDETTDIIRQILVEEMAEIRTDCRAILAHQQQSGQAIGALGERVCGLEKRCAERGQHCSGEFRGLRAAVGKAEDTGVHHLLELREGQVRRSTWVEIGKFLVVALGAAGTVVAIWASVSSSSGKTQHHRAPAAVVDARR
jgi:hypothetical protein